MKIGLYARVSTDKGKQDSENQLIQLREFAVAQGWEIFSEYVDHVSGKNGDRPAFKRMFDDARHRRFDLVLFWSLDRLSREGVLATLRYLEELTAAGVGWRSFTEQYLDSCGIFKDAVLAILAVVAKQERTRISERVCAGLKNAKSKGTVLGQPARVFDKQKLKDLIDSGAGYRAAAKELGISTGLAHKTIHAGEIACIGNGLYIKTGERKRK